MRTIEIALCACLAGTWLAAGPASAVERPAPVRSAAAQWQAECGSCHLAYPAALLPTASWRRIMGGLDRHFGVDAALEPQVRADILAYLERGAERAHAGAAPDRITETGWFKREHGEVPANTWRLAKVRTASNCAACHTTAERGVFDEESVRIPR